MNFPLNIAYNMTDRKVGCVLLQPLIGGDLTGGEVSRYFNIEAWELSPSKLEVFTVASQQEFDAIVKITNRVHKHNRV